jgi:hypothetical protein
MVFSFFRKDAFRLQKVPERAKNGLLPPAEGVLSRRPACAKMEVRADARAERMI